MGSFLFLLFKINYCYSDEKLFGWVSKYSHEFGMLTDEKKSIENLHSI